jgi:sulfite exporter TauE/SafE
MVEFPVAFMSGLLGSAHCVGMCGGFALLLGLNTRSPGQNLLAQGVYSSGRLFTYMVLGTAAGFAGGRLAGSTLLVVNASAILSIVAGLVLIQQGLLAAGIRLWGWGSSSGAGGGCLAVPVLRHFLTSSRTFNRFLAGVLTGLLPCGLLYATLALAAATRQPLAGAAMLGLFGVGTTPLMLLTGAGGNLLSVSLRQRLLYGAAWCVVLTGAWTVIRGSYALQFSPAPAAAVCPFCEEQAAQSTPPSRKTTAACPSGDESGE